MVSQEGGIGRGNRGCTDFLWFHFVWQHRGSPELTAIRGFCWKQIVKGDFSVPEAEEGAGSGTVPREVSPGQRSRCDSGTVLPEIHRHCSSSHPTRRG